MIAVMKIISVLFRSGIYMRAMRIVRVMKIIRINRVTRLMSCKKIGFET